MNEVVLPEGVAVVTRAAMNMTRPAAEMKAQVQVIQEVMRAVMKPDVHFGRIPGAGDKPTLLKPGSEVLLSTFRIAVEPDVLDLSTADEVRYRVTAIGRHQGTGIVIGAGIGEASSSEEKYRWRAAVCDEEFDSTPEDRKRLKWRKGQNGAYSVRQIRTCPADVANTVLKMAKKRAQVDLTLTALGASDCFSQDLEDMPEEMRGDYGAPQDDRPRGRPATQAPQRSQASQRPADGAGNASASRATEKQIGLVQKRLDAAGVPENDFLRHFQIDAITDLPFAKVDAALEWIRSMQG